MTKRRPSASRAQNPSSQPSIEPAAPPISRIGGVPGPPDLSAPRAATVTPPLPFFPVTLIPLSLPRRPPRQQGWGVTGPPERPGRGGGTVDPASSLASRSPVPPPPYPWDQPNPATRRQGGCRDSLRPCTTWPR